MTSESLIDRISKILDRRAFLIWPWENPKSEHYGKEYVFGMSAPKAIEKRRRAANKKAAKIVELFNQPGVEK